MSHLQMQKIKIQNTPTNEKNLKGSQFQQNEVQKREKRKDFIG
jgi:hypothetical protein